MRPTVIIVVGIILIFGVPVYLLIMAKLEEKYNYQCTECSYIFNIFENKFNYGLRGKSYIKCPKCGKYSYVKYVRKK